MAPGVVGPELKTPALDVTTVEPELQSVISGMTQIATLVDVVSAVV
jgi:hypothetical protein